MEADLSMVSTNRINDFKAVAWDIVKQITASGSNSYSLHQTDSSLNQI